jgi:hypothetical protein
VGLIRVVSISCIIAGVGSGFGTLNARCVVSSGSDAIRSRVGLNLKYSRAFSGSVATTARLSTPSALSLPSRVPSWTSARRQKGHHRPSISERNKGLRPR